MGFDANGTGWAPVIAVEGLRPVIGEWLAGGVRASYAAIHEQFETGRTQVGIVEAQVQAQLALGVVRPYLGIGVGGMAFLSRAGTREAINGVASLAGGVRSAASRRLGVGLEGRIRQWHPTAGRGNVELTVSLARRF